MPDKVYALEEDERPAQEGERELWAQRHDHPSKKK